MWRDDQVPKRSKHRLLTGHTHRAPLVEIIEIYVVKTIKETTVI
jgi:hypothetical protein